MIIKFRENETWILFGEIDYITYKQAFAENEEQGHKDMALFYEATAGDDKPHRMMIEFFTKNMTDTTVIFACSPIYLMNSDGKTIETI